jgi:hypothetical protein
MFGTLAGALSGRKIPFDRQQFTATVDGHIVGEGRTIRIETIALHYELTAPSEQREAIERERERRPPATPVSKPHTATKVTKANAVMKKLGG